MECRVHSRGADDADGLHTQATLVAVVAVLWSPEPAAVAIAVHGLCTTLRFGLQRALASSAAVLFGSYAGAVLLHRAVFGVWMDPAAFLEYVLHVPGPLPIDPASDILLMAASLGLGGWLVVSAPDVAIRRRDLATTALLFATSCYCFGRSHPNNICNLALFLVLVGARALDRAQDARGAIVAHGLAVSVAALTFSPWRIMPFDPHVGVNVGDLLAVFPAFEADVEGIHAALPSDPKLGIAVFGPYRARHPTGMIVWTPMTRARCGASFRAIARSTTSCPRRDVSAGRAGGSSRRISALSATTNLPGPPARTDQIAAPAVAVTTAVSRAAA